MEVKENSLNIDQLFQQFNELAKQYLTNPIFRSNMNLLMQIPIKEKDIENMLYVAKFMQDEHYYRLSDERSSKPWKPTILNGEETLNLITPPPYWFKNT